MRRRTVYILSLLLCSGIILAGCRKDLCYDHDIHGLKVRTVLYPQWELEWEYEHGIDWDTQWDSEQFLHEYEEFTPEQATGIAAFVYHEDGTNTENHLPAEGGELPMSEGEKSLLFYNDDTRYILFGDMSSSATATATTRTRTRSTFAELHAGERTVNAPDVLFGEWIEEHHAEVTAEPVPLSINMQPLVYTYLVRYEFESGLEHFPQGLLVHARKLFIRAQVGADALSVFPIRDNVGRVMHNPVVKERRSLKHSALIKIRRQSRSAQ